MFATLTGMLPVFLVGAMEVQITHSLHFGPGALGTAVSISFAAAMVSAVPASRITERITGTRMMRIGTAAQAVLLMLVALTARSWVVLALLLAMSGAVSGALPPATYQFLSRRTRDARQGLAYGMNQAAVPLGPLLGGLAVPAVALTLGWRWAFALAALISLLASVLVPRPWAKVTKRSAARTGRERPRIATMPLTFLAVALFLGMFATNGLLAFLASGAVALGFTKGAAGLVVAVGGASAVVARVVTGYRADGRAGGHFRVVAIMMAIGAGGYALVALSAGVHVAWLLVPAAALGLGAGWGWNALFILAVVRSHQHAPARATGLVDVGGRLGGVLGPLTAGLLIAHGSYTAAWSVVAAAALAGAVIVDRGGRMLASGQ